MRRAPSAPVRPLAAALTAVLLLLAGAVPAVADERPEGGEHFGLADYQQLLPYASTPDQGTIAPEIPRGRAALESNQLEPEPLPVLPDVESSPPGEGGKQYPFCTRKAGPYQRQVERYLGLKADGRQSAADCAAIQAYQRKRDIWPAVGYAGAVTHGELLLAKVRKNPNKAGRCPTGVGRVVCVDLDRQLLWMQSGAKLLFAPVPVRTGRPGYDTRTGMHRVYWRNKDHWSTLYDAPMPYSQFFDGGQALHGTYASVYREPGSHGCVNLRFAESKALWHLMRKGDRVYVFGTRPVR
ncbi:L,D-transpeptidase [Streptomyces sp. NPDC051940]|uniref:L,D-transpeptidase n=1 Tax=Streptomyces sp. NPDC051940 TaxID=3155675 RepID=UPI003449E96C